MPKAEEILDGLHAIANDYVTLAKIWHLLFYILIVALLAGWKPSNQLLASILCLPLLTVALLAWMRGNPFNGTSFTVLAIIVFIFSMQISGLPVTMSQKPFVVAGILIMAFGLVYPHFIETNSHIGYLYASPAGLIPCPTLSVVIGFLLVFNGLNSAYISLAFVIAGLFYGLFGLLKLKVQLDLFLVVGAVVLLIKYFSLN
ncbi:hypothetical protein [Prolixibacter sp. NT017]|uniref:hypothetical protein n=1 Tax=Prolixibacter sp. NT017 TaxID=2652390 RepID=UPI001277431C|nr:hypothetical protein [Prolixibacter sp. NT017]GET25157.1 hypothetical protein NT017_14860 [Prolixibacter sp. NT017]